MKKVQPSAPIHGARTILFIVSLSSFMTAFMGSSLNIALPALSAEFTLSSVQTGWIASSYLLSSVVFLLSFGRLGDMHGRKYFFITGAFITIISSIASIYAGTGNILITIRAFQGIGASMLFSSSIPIMTSAFPPNKRGSVLGISVACVYLGLSMGPFFGGILTQSFGWRYIFIFIIIGMSIVFALALRVIPADRKKAHGVHFDIRGALLYGASVLSIILGLSWILSAKGIITITAGFILLIMFFVYEFRQDHPLIPVRVFRHNRLFILSNFAAMINYSATFAVGFFMSLYLQHVKDYSPREAGMILIIQPIIQALFSPITGRISDSRDPRVLASAGMGLIACALAAMALIPGVIPTSIIIVMLAFLGMGFALFSSPNNNTILGSVDHSHLGIASSILSSMRTFGQVLSMAIAILLLSYFVGSKAINKESVPAFMATFKIALSIFSILCLLGIGASLSRLKKKKN